MYQLLNAYPEVCGERAITPGTPALAVLGDAEDLPGGRGLLLRGRVEAELAEDATNLFFAEHGLAV